MQVINQYVIGKSDGAKHDNRYDVTILVNGFPLVHVELKRRGVAIREAFNKINSGQEVVCLNILRFSLFQTEQTQNTIPTAHVSMLSRMLMLHRVQRKVKQAIALNSHHSGQMQTIVLSRI